MTTDYCRHFKMTWRADLGKQQCNACKVLWAPTPRVTAGEYKAPAIEIRHVNELTVKDGDVIARGHASVVPMLREILTRRAQESFVMLIVGSNRRVLGYREVARGLVDQVQVPVGEMFRVALICGAQALYIAHNHPSGDPSPSPQDVFLTAALRQAGALISCPILDHIIIGGGERYFSFADGGWQSTAQLPMGERQGPELDD